MTTCPPQVKGRQTSTVTYPDPDLTRYFMTVQEAEHLVIQANAAGRDGETSVHCMSEHIGIGSVACQLTGSVELSPDTLCKGLRLREDSQGEPFRRYAPDPHTDCPRLACSPSLAGAVFLAGRFPVGACTDLPLRLVDSAFPMSYCQGDRRSSSAEYDA